MNRLRELDPITVRRGMVALIVVGIVYITKGQRRIPIQQGRQMRGRRVYGGQRHYLPLKVNQAGVMPIIFASFLSIVATLGLGLFISTLGRNQAQVPQVAFLFLLPNVLLSGFMFPREAMPELARAFGLLLPLTYFLQVIRGIVLKGNGLMEVWPQTLALAGFAFAFFLFATRRFSKTLE
mgnify:CR=1 FL=1